MATSAESHGYTAFELKDMEADPHTREEDILKAVHSLEIPLLSGARSVYGPERGWLICGPTSILLGYFLSAVTDVPLMQADKTVEHLEFRFWINNPADPKNKWKFNDHTTTAYYPAARDRIEEIFVFDTVGQFLNHTWSRLDGGIYRYHANAEDIVSELRGEPGWDRYDEALAAKEKFTLLNEKPPTTREDLKDFMHLIHKPDVFDNIVTTRRGKEANVSSFFGTPLRLAAGATIQIAEQTLAVKSNQKLPGGMSAGEFIGRLKRVPHIIPRG